MARLLRDTCPLAAEILDGQHDENLTFILESVQARMKAMFRKGAKVTLHGTKNPTLDGQVGTVLKVNAKRISVGVGEPTTDQWGTTYSLGEFNVPPTMLKAAV